MTIQSGQIILAADVLRHANVDGRLEVDTLTALTIASGVVTVTNNWNSVDTEGAAASDDLDTITPGSNVGDGFVLFLRAANDARTVILRHGTGNIYCANGRDVILDNDYDLAIAIYSLANTRWVVTGTVLDVLRVGGSATAYGTQGSTQYPVNTSLRVQMGVQREVLTGSSGAVGVTFPEPFSDVPMVFVQPQNQKLVAAPSVIAANQATVSWLIVPGQTAFSSTNIDFQWLAVGPR